MVILALLVILIAVIIMIAYHKGILAKMEHAESIANETVSGEDENPIRKVYIPDNADANDASTKSTQDVDCKTYTVDTNQAVEKTVVGSNGNEDETEDDPIKNL